MSGASGDMGNLLKQAQKMQAEIDRMESELAEARLEGIAGGGAVKALVSGDSQVVAIEVSDEAFASNDKQLFQEMVTAAVKDGIERARQLKRDRMKQAMGGLDLPGIDVPVSVRADLPDDLKEPLSQMGLLEVAQQRIGVRQAIAKRSSRIHP